MARNLTDPVDGFLRTARQLIHDRDPLDTRVFGEILASGDVGPIRLPPKSPNLNASAVRFVQSINEECLHRVLGEVAVDHHEPPAGSLEVRGHEPPLSVEPRHAQGGVHPDGLELRVEADTAIAPALGDRERRVPARRPTGGRWDVLGPRADLLDADDIGAGPVHKIHEPVPDTRANPVDVPAHDPHPFYLRAVGDRLHWSPAPPLTGGAR